ncbi:cytochrome c oxidase, cbb3 subunit III [Haloferula helveola]|uniref:Cytochrome c oxidase, cbb3 subunit III n=1 Tax=Haloferula helveola TaxID=490095 RepID=A0ABM7RE23_9BACT|nr:cytochrome c oxidase, cbb3 subunit III [Haloferula helveola]
MKSLTAFLLLPLSLFAEDTPDYSEMKVDKLFETLCSGCHGKDLSGGQGGSLIDGEWKHGATEAEIRKSIAEGNPQLGMTPFSTVLDDNQIRSLVIYIREKEKEALAKGIDFPKPEPGKVTQTAHEDYTIETVADDGLKLPWALAFLPDGRKLVTERGGQLRIIGADGKLDPQPVKGTPEVIAHGQGGLLEVAVHPGYESNGWVYLAFSDGWWEKGAGKEGKDGKKADKPQTITAVVRGRIKDHEWVDQEWIWKTDKPFYTDAGVHFGTRIVFNKGYVYFIVGERGGMMESQDLNNPKGKIYRLFDDGREPEDNPFVGTEGAIKGIWTYGHRNPQGLDIDPRDGSIYSTEHGPRGGDELNWIRKGLNYGWPVITYGMNYNGTPITGITEKEGMEQPVTYWVPSIATCGLDFYTGDRFPEWKNDLFAGALAQKEVRRLRIKDHKVVEEEVILKDLGRVRDVTDGPDGYLYVILNDPDSILRLAPAE